MPMLFEDLLETWSMDREIVLVKVLNHPRSKVFSAWLDPAALSQWYGPDGPEGAERLEMPWYAQTGDFQWLAMDKKHVKRLSVKLSLQAGASFQAQVQYDSSGVWETILAMQSPAGRVQRNLPILPRRCDHFRLRLEGRGPVKLQSLAMVYSRGTERS